MLINRISVVGWADYEDKEDCEEQAIGGFGGFFSKGMRWSDYVARYDYAGRRYAEALRSAIIERGLKCTGREHQAKHFSGVPIYSDGKVALFSFRAWGDLMAAVWSEHENKDYSYVDFLGIYSK